MHTNHRRKTKTVRNKQRPRYGVSLSPYKQMYWQRERARARTLLAHVTLIDAGFDVWLEGHYGEPYEDLQDSHPKTILWEAL